MKSCKKGFTLTELMVVVAILGVLVAIAVPVFTASLNKTRLAVDDANVRSLQTAISLAQIENEVLIDGKKTALVQAATHQDPILGTGGYYVTSNGALTTDSQKAYVLQGSREKDPTFLNYNNIDEHIRGARLALIFQAIPGGATVIHISSDAQ